MFNVLVKGGEILPSKDQGLANIFLQRVAESYDQFNLNILSRYALTKACCRDVMIFLKRSLLECRLDCLLLSV
jgi:hypothetical protein